MTDEVKQASIVFKKVTLPVRERKPPDLQLFCQSDWILLTFVINSLTTKKLGECETSIMFIT